MTTLTSMPIFQQLLHNANIPSQHHSVNNTKTSVQHRLILKMSSTGRYIYQASYKETVTLFHPWEKYGIVHIAFFNEKLENKEFFHCS